ncbi:MAG: YigZ family protein [Oscillospiraceae bacterium]|nr:YigZ family protein [Oscillospiraceae bacterium]
MNSYKTVRKAASDEYVVKKSRFIGHIAPVTTAEQALEFIAAVSKKHWDATHNVYAYILREGGIKRYSDDGEPQGTAGIPTLDVLEKSGVTDCAVVVTRYFGGIMLGAGGLVRAYSHSASIAVAAGGIVTRAMCAGLKVTCDYYFYGKLSSLVPESGGVIEDTVFEDNVTLIFRLPLELVDGFNAKLIDVSNGRYRAEKTGEFFADVD